MSERSKDIILPSRKAVAACTLLSDKIKWCPDFMSKHYLELFFIFNLILPIFSLLINNVF